MEPNFVPAHGYLGMALEQQGRYAEAIEEYQTAYGLSGGNRRYQSDLAVARARSGDSDQARELLVQLLDAAEQGQVHAFLVARVYAALDDVELALTWLEQGHEQGGVWMLFLKVDPLFDVLRGDPRFRDLVARVGLL